MTAMWVKVWDPVVRLFHWTLVTSCIAAYITQEQDYELHVITGYTVLALILLRIPWGLAGPTHARFTEFLVSPRKLLCYLKALTLHRAPRFLGHNPAGGVMVVLLLLTLMVITLSGIALDAAENRAGPLAATRLFLYTDTIKDIHTLATDLGLVLVCVHLLGVLHASLIHRENLVRAMFNGRKRAGVE